MLSDIEFQGDNICFLEPLQLFGEIANSGHMLQATLSIKGTVKLQCGGCTAFYDNPIELSFDAMFRKDAEFDNPDVFLLENDTINFHDAVQEHVLLNLPTRKRCKIDCKGLCVGCGADLNTETCTCSDSENRE